MKIIGFAGSNSKKSINKQLVKYTLSQITSAETEELDITDYPLPIYGIDLEKESGIPQAVHDFIDKVQTADGLVISLAEHNGSYTVAVKNLLDWCSRCETGFFKNMPVLLMGASPGGYGAKNVLGAAEKRFPKFGAQLISIYSFPSFDDNFSKENGIVAPELKKEHDEAIRKLIDSLK